MCQQRSKFALTSDTDRSTYRCDVGACQYPHCAGSGCTTPRPRDIPFIQQLQWLCKHCKPPTETAAKTKTCVKCGKEKNADEYDDHADNKRMRRCRACMQKKRECIGCGTTKPAGDFEHSATRPKHIAKYAIQCGSQWTANLAGGPSRDQTFATELTRASPSTAAQRARITSSAPWRRVRLGVTQMPSAGRGSRKSSCAGPASRIAAAQTRHHP